MRGVKRNALALVIAVVSLSIVSSCQWMTVGESPLEAGTRWQIVSMDALDLTAAEMYLEFQPQGSLVGLTSPCPVAQLPVKGDTAGGAIAFGRDDFDSRGRPVCSEESIALFRDVLAALEEVHGWERVGGNVDLVGASRIRLVQLGEVAPTDISRSEASQSALRPS